MARIAHPEFTIGIVADLHAHDVTGDNAPSFLNIRQTELTPNTHPIEGLLELIDERKLNANLLVCAGDLADKAKPEAIQYAWGSLERIRKKLGASECIATAGNHDVDSRHEHTDHDAKGFLQQLKPRFPIKSERLFDTYWSRHFAVVRKTIGDSACRVVTINSAAYHGETSTDDSLPEYHHGRISDWTLNALQSELKKSQADLNILVCHHPPHPHSEHGLLAGDTMKGGQQLLNILEADGEWFVVHGHKHHPKLSNASGNSMRTPIVFAAGSLCANIWERVEGEARNQFYTVTFPLQEFSKLGLVGRFSAWDWTPPHGWRDATARSGLPNVGGFGTREKPLVLAQKVAKSFRGRRKDWRDLCKKNPELRYIMPGDLKQLRELLKNNHEITPFPEEGVLEIHRVERAS